MLFEPSHRPQDLENAMLRLAAIVKLDGLAQEISRLNSEVEQVIAQPEATVYMIDGDPRVVIKSFYALSLQLLSELRVLLMSQEATGLHAEVLTTFVLEGNDSISSITPDIASAHALAGQKDVPSLQKNYSLNLRTLLLVLRFLDMDKIIAAAKAKSDGRVTDEMMHKAVSELVATHREPSTGYEALYERLDAAGLSGMSLGAITGTLVTYLVGIKDLIDPANLGTTQDLYSNILVIFATALEIAEMLSQMKAETQEMSQLDLSQIEGAAEPDQDPDLES